MELLSLMLQLRPLPQADPTAILPAWWGRAAHALFLDVIRQYNPMLASEMHANPSSHNGNEEPENTTHLRPFTVSNLLGRFRDGTMDEKGIYRLRFTSLRQDITDILLQAAKTGPLSPGSLVELDYLKFQVTPAEHQYDATKGAVIHTGYQEISAPFLLAQKAAPRRLNFHFTSPTTFRSAGRHVPFPMPDLVFNSLLERWNAFAPITFPADVRRFAAECLALGRYELRTKAVPIKAGGLRIGAVGEISYACLNYDRYWMSLLAVLAAFSSYAGVGAATSMGLGQCKPVEELRKIPVEQQ